MTKTARTKNIPKPIPALKIPAIAVHELTVINNDSSNNMNIELYLDFFIVSNFDYGYKRTFNRF